jgi:DsbC/DsbD-like thiol-disulfide interchange protein
VTGSIGNGTVAKGEKARGTILMTIPGGLHVNSNRPSSEYAIPTVVTIRSSGVRLGRVSYPRGKNRKFQFSENSINVYEGRVSFPFTVTVPENFRGKTIRVNASVRYQACTDEVCYPPKTKNIVLTARVN